MPTDGVNKRRRRFLVATTSAVGAIVPRLQIVGFAGSPGVQMVQAMLEYLNPGHYYLKIKRDQIS